MPDRWEPGYRWKVTGSKGEFVGSTSDPDAAGMLLRSARLLDKGAKLWRMWLAVPPTKWVEVPDE